MSILWLAHGMVGGQVRDKEGAMRDLEDHGMTHKRRALQVGGMTDVSCQSMRCSLPQLHMIECASQPAQC